MNLRTRIKVNRIFTMMLICAMLVAYAVPFAAQAEEPVYLTGDVLVNGGFEEVDPQDATDAIGWDEDGGQASTAYKTGTGSQRSMKLQPSGEGTTVSVTQDVYVVEGQRYTLFHKAYTPSIEETRKSGIQVTFLDANGASLGDQDIAAYDVNVGPGVWGNTPQTTVVFTTPAGTESVRVYIYAQDMTGPYFYDAMSLTGAIPPSDLPLSAPADVTATAVSHEQVDLSWTASEGNVFGYKVLKDGTEIADVTETAYSDTEVVPETTYTYTIQAYNPNETMTSADVTVTTPEAPAEPTLSAPTDVTAVATAHDTVDVTWTAAEGIVDGYTVYRDGVEVGDVTGTSFTDTGLFELTQYSYTVEAYNAEWALASDAVTVTTAQGPFEYETGELLVNGSIEEIDAVDPTDAIGWDQNGAEASTDWKNGDGSRSLKLSASSADTLVSASQEINVVEGKEYKFWYKVYEHTDVAGDDRKTEVVLTYLDTAGNQVGEEQVVSSYDAVTRPSVWQKSEEFYTIPAGVSKVEVYVYAENFTGAYYYDLFSFTGAIPVALTAPSDVSVDAVTYAGAKLSWSPVAGDVTGYKILRDGEEVGDVNITSFSDTTLEASTAYSYVVEAYNASQSAASEAVTVTTLAAPAITGELLLNSNFEEFDADTMKPLQWEATDGVRSTDDYRRHGTYSLQFAFGGDTDLRLSAKQTVSALDQYVYKLRSHFHDPNGVGPGSYPDRVSEIVIHYLDAAGEELTSEVLVRYDQTTTNTSTYKENIREFTTPEGTAAFTVEMYGEGFGNFFLYDWLQLSLVGIAPDAPQPPEAPARVVGVVAPSETEIELEWTAVTSGNVNSYKLYRDGVEIAEVAGTTYTDTGLTPDTDYSYTVTAINNVGESVQSEPTVITTTVIIDNEAPDRPVLRADAESSSKIVLRWKGVHDNIRVADHEVYRNGELIADDQILMGDYVDQGLTPGTTYSYQVLAVDDSGNKSEISNIAYATTFDGEANQYIEGLVQLNYYIDEPNANIIYRLGPGYVGETGLTSKAVVTLPAGDETFTQAITDTTKTVISVPISDWSVGEYPVALSITDSAGNIVWATEDDILKNPAPAPNTRVTQVDHDREIMLVDGEPYYPIGVFGADADSMQQLADAGFNTTLRWKGYTTWPSYDMDLEPDDPANVAAISNWLDAVDAAGMYAYESPVKMAEEQYYHKYKDPDWDEKYKIHNEIITPGVLETAATHPAVIGYYSYDEVDNFYECCPTYSDHVVMQHGVEEWYDVVKELDPYHAVMTLFAVGISKNSDWNAWDVVARDYYFNDTKHMSDVYETMRDSADTARQWNDPFIATPLFEESSAQRKPLNGIEQRASSYASIIAGARGMYYWDWAAVYNDNWEMLKQVAGEMNALSPILTERIPMQSVLYADGTAQKSNEGMSKNAQAMITNHDGKSYLLTVNTENAPIEVTFTLPAEHSGTGTVWFEDREVLVVGGTFTDTFEPYGRHVYELPGTWVEGNEISINVTSVGTETVYVDPEYAPASKNLILNSSFEESFGSTPGVPAIWFNGDSIMNSGQTGPDGEWHVDDDESYHGDASMRLTEPEGGVYDDIFLYQVPGIHQGGLSYPAAGTYTYSVWMKADRPDVTVTLQESWSTFEDVEVGTEWARYSVPIVKTGAGGGFVAVYVLDQGTVWVDAMQMEFGDTATDYEAPVLTNPDTYTGSVASPEGAHPVPTAPTALTATAVSSSQVDLTWTASTDDVEVTGYKVYRGGVEVGTTTTETTFSDVGLEASTAYTYTVTALDADGHESPASVPATVTTLAPMVGMFSDDFENGAGLWTVVKGPWEIIEDGGSKVYAQNTTDAQMGESLVVAGDANWTDYSFSADVEKKVYHRAGIVGRVANNNTFYELFLASNYGEWQLIKHVNGAQTEIASGPFTSENHVVYNLQLNFAGDTIQAVIDGELVGTVTDASIPAGKIGLRTFPSRAFFDNVLVEEVELVTVIEAPTGLAATAVSDTQVDLTWTASTSEEVTGYHVYRDGVQVGTSATTAFSDVSGLSAEVTYAYTVKAYDADGNLSAASEEVQVTTPAAMTSEGVLTGQGYVFTDNEFVMSYGITGISSAEHQQVNAIDLTIEYDETLLQLDPEVVVLNEGASIVTKVEGPGKLRILAASLGDTVAVNEDWFGLNFTSNSTVGTAEVKVTKVLISNTSGVELEIPDAVKQIVVGSLDISGDGEIKIGDLSILAVSFGASEGESNWNPQADFNGDGTIDIVDLALLAQKIVEEE